jgi:phenylacetic acid degradation protein PaaD
MTGVSERLKEFTTNDPFAELLGIKLVEGGKGYALVSMDVTRNHLNFLGGGHGGAIFAFADMAFGLASNSHQTICIGINANISFIKGVAEGDQLRAEAHEVARNRKTAVYVVNVTCEEEMIATFNGTVHISSRDHDNLD